jgi:ABC-type Fe3+/spermidine/putrescine transport system ATPase subunit
VLLLDEPLGALDLKLRKQMQVELARIHRQVRTTFVFVTHDQEEALSMADRIAVMDRGRILQIAPPDELYESPNCRMVADFIGTTNLFPGRVLARGDRGIRLEAEGIGELHLPQDFDPGGEVGIAVRPEKVRISHERPADGLIAVPGRIAQLAYFGDYSHVFVEAGASLRITCYRTNHSRHQADALAVGDACWVSWHPADCILLTE